MAITFEKDPFGWVHPFYRRNALLNELDSFLKPAITDISSKMNDFFEMSPLLSTPRLISKGDKFEMKLDVQQFAPQELDVKIVDNFLIIEGKHEEKQDEHGYVSRHFVRKYSIPADVKPETITCDLSSDGVLQISAPRMIEDKTKENEKVIPIKYTGLPAITSSGDDKGKAKKPLAA